MALPHEALTAMILASIFEVHNDVGVGLDEQLYHQSLLDCFVRKDIPVVSKARKSLEHRGIEIRRFELDLLVFEKIILTLKSVDCDFLQNHYVQIISELKLWQKDLGLLVNFGRLKAKIERIPFDEKEKKSIEDYSEIKGKLDESLRQLLARVRDAILFAYETHGLGYGTVVCRDLIRAELDYQRIVYQRNPVIQVKFQGRRIRACKAKALCIADQIL